MSITMPKYPEKEEKISLGQCKIPEKYGFLNVYTCLVKRKGYKQTSAPKITIPGDVFNFLLSRITGLDREKVFVIYLNTKNRVLGIQELSSGTLDSSLIDIKNLLKPAILSSSSSIIVAHNHPSGILEPSRDDVNIARKIKDAVKACDITLLDFIILTEDSFFSFVDNKLL